MPSDIHVVYDDAALALVPYDPRVILGADRLAAEAETSMKAHCPVAPPGAGHVSGHLRASIQTERLLDEYHIGPTADYGAYVNDGTLPHVIRSHGNYPLRDAYGHVFGRTVHHPGTRGAHFIEAAGRDIDGRRVQL